MIIDAARTKKNIVSLSLLASALLFASSAFAEEPIDPPPAEPPSVWPAPAEETVAPGELKGPHDKVAPSHREPEAMRWGILAGLSFPRPVAVSSFLQWDRRWTLGAEFSMLPATNIAGVNTNFWAAAAEGRVHPFHGAFYVGMKSGYQHLSADGYITTSGVSALAQGSVDSVFVNPEIGFLFTWDSGLAVGFGAGIQIPIWSQSSTTSNIPVSSDVLATVGKLGTGEVPTVDLLRVGLVF